MLYLIMDDINSILVIREYTSVDINNIVIMFNSTCTFIFNVRLKKYNIMIKINC